MSNIAETPSSGFVTSGWVKKRYAISNSTLYKWTSEGYFPAPLKIGPRAIRFRIEDIILFENSKSL